MNRPRLPWDRIPPRPDRCRCPSEKCPDRQHHVQAAKPWWRVW